MLTEATLWRHPANTGTPWGWQVSSQIPLPGFSAWDSGPHFLNHLGQTGWLPTLCRPLSQEAPCAHLAWPDSRGARAVPVTLDSHPRGHSGSSRLEGRKSRNHTAKMCQPHTSYLVSWQVKPKQAKTVTSLFEIHRCKDFS